MRHYLSTIEHIRTHARPPARTPHHTSILEHKSGTEEYTEEYQNTDTSWVSRASYFMGIPHKLLHGYPAQVTSWVSRTSYFMGIPHKLLHGYRAQVIS